MKVGAKGSGKRPYRMRARAEATAATRSRILDATLLLIGEQFLDEISLEQVADRAGVTVPTVLRHFGSRSALLAAAGEDVKARVVAQRDEAPAGDIPGAVANLVAHYEEWGDWVLHLLAQEARFVTLQNDLAEARAVHRRWTERTFEPFLASKRGVARRRLRAQLVAVCDVYTWKILRKDLRLGRGEVERALEELLSAVVGGES